MTLCREDTGTGYSSLAVHRGKMETILMPTSAGQNGLAPERLRAVTSRTEMAQHSVTGLPGGDGRSGVGVEICVGRWTAR